MNDHPFLRVVRELEEPISLFLRPAKQDHKFLSDILSKNAVGFSGVVFDPRYEKIQKELKLEIQERKLDATLDPGTMELSTVGGFESRKLLPWAGAKPWQIDDFQGKKGQQFITTLGAYILEHGFSSVLAPTHYLAKGVDDMWFDIDLALTRALRNFLNKNGGEKVRIYYPLITNGENFLRHSRRVWLKEKLSKAPIDSIWLRIHPFGNDSSSNQLRKYIEACRDFHELKIPLISEHVGILGLALVGFGAVSGLGSGITLGNKFDYKRLLKKNDPDKEIKLPKRIYIQDLGFFVTEKEFKTLFSHRILLPFACRNTDCCQNGMQSMVENYKHHFLVSRMGEIAALGKTPSTIRSQDYLETFLRSSTDRLGRVLNIDLEKPMKLRVEKERRKQDSWRAALGDLAKLDSRSFSIPLPRQISRAG